MDECVKLVVGGIGLFAFGCVIFCVGAIIKQIKNSKEQ